MPELSLTLNSVALLAAALRSCSVNLKMAFRLVSVAVPFNEAVVPSIFNLAGVVVLRSSYFSAILPVPVSSPF